jgi:hypothetical protein
MGIKMCSGATTVMEELSCTCSDWTLFITWRIAFLARVLDLSVTSLIPSLISMCKASGRNCAELLLLLTTSIFADICSMLMSW